MNEGKRSFGGGSPRRLLLMLCVAVFIIELLLMLLLDTLPPLSRWGEAMLDSALLVVSVFPLVYYFAFRPLRLQITARQQAEAALQQAHDQLQQRLTARTEELRLANDALCQSEKRLHDVTFSMADWIWEVDEHGVYTYSSQQGLDLLGRSLEELVGKTPFDFMPSDESTRVKAIFSDLAAKKAPITDLENWNIRRTGELICLLTNGVPILDKEGRLRGYRGVDKNITERKRSEDSLRLLSSVVEQSTDGMAIADLDGNLLFVNNAWCRMHGYDGPEKLLGKNLAIFHNQEQMANDVRPFKERVMDFGACSGEIGHITRDGRPFPTLMTTTLLNDKQGKPFAMVGIAQDITERKRAEEQLRLSENKLRVLLSQAPAILWTTDQELRFTWLTGTGATRYGRKVDDLLGKTIGESLAGDDPTGEGLASHRRALEGKPAGYEINYQKWRFDCHVEPLRDIQGKIIGCIGAALDITEHRRIVGVLRDNEVKYRCLFEGLVDAAFLADAETGQIVDANQQAGLLLGKTREEIIGLHHSQLHPADEAVRFKETFVRNAAEERSVDLEGHVIRKDGTLVPVSIRATNMNIGDRRFRYGLMRDITERKHIEQHRERLVSILDATPHFVGFANAKDTQILYINPAGRRMIGFEREEDVTRFKISDIHPEWTNKLFHDEILPAAIRDGTWTGECAFLNRDGREIPVLMVLLAHRSTSGEVERFSTISRDITERKRTEEELSIKNSAIASSITPMALNGLDGTFLYANSAFARLMGFDSASQLLGKTPADITLDKAHTRNITSIIQEKGSYRGPEKLKRKDGSIIDLDLSVSVVKGLNGSPTCWMASFVDITEQNQIEEALRASNEKFARAFQANPVPTAVVTLDCARFLDVNQSFLNTYGYSREEVIGHSAFELGIWVDPSQRAEFIQALREKREAPARPVQMRTKAGEIREIIWGGTLIQVGHETYLLGSGTDITERKRAEEAIRELNQRLEERVRQRTTTIRRLAIELTRAEQLERSRLAQFLHDDLQPLLVSAKYDLWMAAQDCRGQTRKLLMNAEKNLSRSAQAARTLSVELCPPILHQEGLSAILKWLGDSMRQKHHLTVRLAIGPIPVLLSWECSVLVYHTLRELLLNVVKHAGVQSVSVVVESKDTDLIVVVSDNGKGFDPASLQTIDSSSTKFGLFAARERLDLMGGQMTVESAPGRGSHFTLRLPVLVGPPVPVGVAALAGGGNDPPPKGHIEIA